MVVSLGMVVESRAHAVFSERRFGLLVASTWDVFLLIQQIWKAQILFVIFCQEPKPRRLIRNRTYTGPESEPSLLSACGDSEQFAQCLPSVCFSGTQERSVQ